MPADVRTDTPLLAQHDGLVRPAPLGGAALVRDYLAGAPEALAFFPTGSPYDLASYRRKLAEVAARFGTEERAAAARCLRPTSAAAHERLRRFVEEGGAVVTTGQQAGFLTGPLYTVFKALAAVALARHLEQELGVLVLPVFWVASEDHDWDEVNHAVVLDAQNRARRYALSSKDERPLPMSERPLEGNLDRILDQIAEAVGSNPSTEDWLRTILDAYRRPGRPVGEAFGEAIGAILARYDVCLADAADPALKALTRPVLRSALVDAEAHESVLADRSAELESAGYRGQVAVLEGGTNVFHHGDAGRTRVYRRGEGFGYRGRKEPLDRTALLAELEEEPRRFSPNVFLRPVVESAAFPTLAYVGGPGELAYFAQVNALFGAYDILPPVAVPRFAGTVVEPKIERLLARLELTMADVGLPREELVERLARREIPGEVQSALNEVRSELTRTYAGLLERMAELDASLAGAVGGARNRSLLEAAKLERKMLRSIKRSDRVATEQLDRVLDSLRPFGKPQDRVLNVLPFLVRYGDHFLKEAERAIAASWRLPG